jgi:hypothetical protein
MLGDDRPCLLPDQTIRRFPRIEVMSDDNTTHMLAFIAATINILAFSMYLRIGCVKASCMFVMAISWTDKDFI